MRTSTDDQLMTAVKNGSSSNLSYLFERYQKPLYNFFLNLTSNQNAAEDLLQDTFFKILYYRKNYREGSSFRAWIYTIARNLYKDYIRKHKVTVNIDEISESIFDPARADQDVLINEERKLIRNALNKLQENKRQVLVLSRFQNLKYEEIGQIMDLNVGTVKVTVFRALKELKANYLKLAGEIS